ncbi:putative kinase [Enterobacter soli]|uniref:host specificity factor TipJ family phage tail protein n=1 Tax=Enterobacter soli TaxID=885040 RepID=UPI000223D2A1|nr:host specificity factor TipJ family phage tail protein [Enterobacter soli]AEN65788.1 putative kinase [Enterobacter soli]OAT35543.1 phage host specificity protein J [Enterobacter soli ATCC BAA-2102]
MTIRIYPSRLPGEPLETHEHGETFLATWFSQNVEGWELDRPHPISVEVNGEPVPVSEWAARVITEKCNVCIYPVPYGTGLEIVAWVAVGVAVASAAYSIFMMSNMQAGGYSQPGNGDQIDLNPAKANSAKLGDPIREIFGKYRVWPDYVVQPVSRFSNEKDLITSMFLAISVGDVTLPSSELRVGNTPFSAFGSDISYTIYPPGADVSGDARSENWFNSPEVGNTTSGTAGLDLGSSGPDTVSVVADGLLLNTNTVTLIGSSSSDDDTEIPPAWTTGTIIDIEAPDTYTIDLNSGYSVIYGSVSEMAPVVGMAMTLELNNDIFDLYVAAYSAAVPAVPGVGGSTASIAASASPTTYDFTSSPQTFTITWKSVTYTVSLTSNYVTMSGLLNAITSQISVSGLRARDNSGRVVIDEQSSPYAGGSITHSALPSSVFGSTPVDTAGVKSTGGTAAVPANLRLAYDSATGTKFAGIPVGSQRLTLYPTDYSYKITAISGLTITVGRVLVTVDSSGNTITTDDPTWPGFIQRTVLDGSVTGINDDYDWIGPFLACPDGETTNRIEVNLNFQNGLSRYNSKGKKRSVTVGIIVQYRIPGASTWTSAELTYSRNVEDQIGFTEGFNVTPAQYEIRMRRKSPPDGGSTRDQCYWQALRSRLLKRPTRYRDITTIALSIRTGNRLGAQSDRRINVTPTRQYEEGEVRSISAALYHVLKSLGYQENEIDRTAIDTLETTYWTPRGETFDFATTDTVSALDMLKTITNAGMGYFLLSDGMASAGREGVKPWSGMITPQASTSELTTSFKAPNEDDYDGVDVTYINQLTWAEETVQCRLPDNPTPVKVESYTLDGVLDQDRAYRIGMRRLLGYQLQRLSHDVSTEMDALCYQFMDRVIFADDIPGSLTLSCLIEDMSYDSSKVTLTLSEAPDWTFPNPRVVIRDQEGKASVLLTPTRIDDYTITVPYSSELSPESWIMDDPSVEPPHLLFCSSTRVGYDALMAEISPGSDGTNDVTAIQYNPGKYQYDDATYPGDVA